MLLKELSSSGTYVAVRPTSATLALLAGWATANNVTLDPELHATLLYSRKSIKVQPNSDEYQARVIRFNVFGDKVVVELHCPALAHRHQELLNAGGTHDFSTYDPHISLTDKCSYSAWKPIDFGLLLGGEYSEELDGV